MTIRGADEVLAERAKSGSAEAFEALVNAHQGRVYGLALQMLRNPEDAADAAQEAFVRAYASLDRFDPHQSFAAWLYRIAHNYCLDVLRRRRRSPIVPAPADEDQPSPIDTAMDPGPSVEEIVIRGERTELLNAVMGRLSEDHRQVLTMRYMLDLPYSEIAGTLDVPESTVTMRLYHAKRALRKQLQRIGEV